MKELKVKITFIEPLLGTASGNPEVHSTFIASKAPDAPSREEEVEALGAEEVEKKEMTVFARTATGKPCLWDYQIKGFFKNACYNLKSVPNTKSENIKAYKKIIDGLIFIRERQIPIIFTGEIGNLQRPLRAQTMQGERVALANSEMIPAGAEITITIQLFKDDHEALVKEWLDYGVFNGIGQWHNGSYGRFRWEEVRKPNGND